MSMIITAKDNDKIKYTKSLLKSKNVKNYIFIDKFIYYSYFIIKNDL